MKPLGMASPRLRRPSAAAARDEPTLQVEALLKKPGALAGVAARSEEEYVEMAVAGRGGLGVRRRGVEGWTRGLERAWVELSGAVD